MSVEWKPKNEQVRLVMTSETPGPFKSEFENNAKVFAVIGPFDDFTDKQDLQAALTTFLSGYNIKRSPK